VIRKDLSKCAIIGASGYAGEELVRLLLRHPSAKLVAVTSRQFAGKSLAQIFPRFSHDSRAKELCFTDSDPAAIAAEAGVVFLALPHGVSAGLAKSFLEQGARVIDLSADFRLRDPAVYRQFYRADHPAPELLSQAVYGLPEFYRAQIRESSLVACPGCYPTSILIPLLPLVRGKLIEPDSILIASLSGVSGAGRKVEADYLFVECNESARPYGVPQHRHLSELEQELGAAAQKKLQIQFVPHLVPMNRGIVSTIFLQRGPDVDEGRIAQAYDEAYQTEPFIRLLGGVRLPDTKNVEGTNFIDVSWKIDPRTGRLIVMSSIDNLVKGTSGQAIQCFNLMAGFEEAAGLM
jgi:N-acetyl-gamma-glutamyl-phosphate reductase